MKTQDVITYYLKGKTLTETAKEFNIAYSKVRKILIENNVEIRSIRKYSLNESYFSSIDTANKAYVLGFLYADGCIGSTLKTVTIALQERDKEVLDFINKELEHTKPLYYKKKRTEKCQAQYVLQLNSVQIWEDLIKIGCVPNKSKNLSFPSIKEEFYPDFIRGYFDGDGSVHIAKNKCLYIRFTGAIGFIKEIQNILHIKCKATINKIHYYRNGKSCTIENGAKKDVNNIIKYIYNGNFKLNRKYEKAKKG